MEVLWEQFGEASFQDVPIWSVPPWDVAPEVAGSWQGQWLGSQLGPVPQTQFQLASPRLQWDAAPHYTQEALQVRALDQSSWLVLAGTAMAGNTASRGQMLGPMAS